PQLPRGRHPRHRRRQEAPRGGGGRARCPRDRDPRHGVPVADLRPPPDRRRRRGALRHGGQDDRGDPRLGRRDRLLVLAVDAGTVVYEEALRWQRLLAAARAADEIDDVLLCLEHDRVYTAGRRADVTAHVLGTRDIRVVRVERGGDVTYHGPGQLVVYPIRKLADGYRARAHVAALEEACIRTAASFGIRARADRERTGAWVGDRKLVAI